MRRLRTDKIHLQSVHETDGEAGQIVVVGRHHAGVLGRLAADEGAAGLHAALGDAGDDGRDLFGHVLSDGDVVEEKRRG